MATSVVTAQRFTRHRPCPICGGHANLPAGRGVRCYGFLAQMAATPIAPATTTPAILTLTLAAAPTRIGSTGHVAAA